MDLLNAIEAIKYYLKVDANIESFEVVLSPEDFDRLASHGVFALTSFLNKNPTVNFLNIEKRPGEIFIHGIRFSKMKGTANE